MTKNTGFEPRKAPVQERSRATVERILDAGVRVLVAHGYDGASTNRIIAEADISPGSLYQYFPNKDAIVVAILDRYFADIGQRLGDELLTHLTDPPEVLVREVLGSLVDILGEQPELLGALYDDIPRRAGIGRMIGMRQRIVDLTRTYLAINQERHTFEDPDLAAWLLIQTAEQLVVRYILDRPPFDRDAFVDQGVRLVEAMLKP